MKVRRELSRLDKLFVVVVVVLVRVWPFLCCFWWKFPLHFLHAALAARCCRASGPFSLFPSGFFFFFPLFLHYVLPESLIDLPSEVVL